MRMKEERRWQAIWMQESLVYEHCLKLPKILLKLTRHASNFLLFLSYPMRLHMNLIFNRIRLSFTLSIFFAVSLGHFDSLEQWMLKGLLTTDAVRWNPLKHFGDQVCTFVDVLLSIILKRKNLSEVAAWWVVELVDQVDGMLSYLAADTLKCFAIW